MKYKFTRQRKIAISLLLLWSSNMFVPSVSYALTSGPAQPETQGFQPVGVSDMVDLQTGDFKYNIPLLDIDGYPINLNYASGVGMDDEASWVGLGWSLNPGAINRQVRGIPDDFAGDNIETDHWTKPKITVGGKATAKAETLGMIGVNGTFSFGVFSDNYTGIGAEIGVNGGMSFSLANSGCMTAALGAGVTSNTQSGVDVSPYVSLSIKEHSSKNWTESAGLSGSLGYNSRSGLKSLTLGTSFGVAEEYKKTSGSGNYNVFGSTISYNTEPLSPSSQLPYHSTYDSFSFDVGGELFGVFSSLGGMGYKSVRKVLSFVNNKPAFGFLYAERGKDNINAQMDFIREKDNPIIKGIPNIAIPIYTPDLWSYTSQAGSGQFRLYRGGTGAFFDSQADDVSDMHSTGGDIGGGLYFHGGLTHFDQTTHNVTRKWKNENDYLANGDFQSQVTNDPKPQPVYFRMVGEKNLEDEEVNPQIQNTRALTVNLATNPNNISTTSDFVDQNGATTNLGSVIAKKQAKRNNRTQISYLTAAEATFGALDKKIPRYDFNTYGTFVVPANNKPVPVQLLDRVDQNHKGHHISEITIADDGGKRMVYGIPVYNTLQTETSFAVSAPDGSGTSIINGNETSVPSNLTSPQSLNRGIDDYYHKESKPAYASSFLLTAILSPDYVDKTNDGITDDDMGTAIKFNYAKLTYSNNQNYRWRSPYQNATVNKGLLADPDDDKGSIIYGEKEIWHVSSIESKTKIAYFITEDRQDALGVAEWQNGGKDNMQTQKRLREIRLYSKADRSRPIKVVKFEYTYQLCPNIPNSADYNAQSKTGSGKLTLSKVWFEYGNSDKGKNHAYNFTYNTGNNLGYGSMLTDRWGNYKDPSVNPNGMDNEHYPYSNQNPLTNNNAGVWHLQKIDLPTGGTINVDYEPGDYAYVQDKKAMVMSGIQSLILNRNGDQTTDLRDAQGVSIAIGPNIPDTDQLTWFKDHFLNGSDYLYTKLFVEFVNENGEKFNDERDYDYVPCYGRVIDVNIIGQTANVIFAPVSEGGVSNKNPVAIAAWQRMKNEYPRYAYPGFDNRLKNDGGVIAAVGAIVNAAKNLSELLEKFYHKADRLGYCSVVDLSKSFVRIVKVDGVKFGGGARVSKVRIIDNWDQTGSTGHASTYGQVYTYTTTEGTKTISSGVAAYEPSIGNDENPLRQPVQYVQTVAGGINNFFDLEMPFCESLYPAPQVVYSKVTVHDLGSDNALSTNTGYTVSECYTAKDFPVKVTVLPIVNHPYQPTSYYSLTNTNSIDELGLSQGYSIELNDMHGKPKATRVFNKAGAEISSTVYYYNAVDNGGTMSLNNQVNVIDQKGQVSPRYLGRDIEFFTDFREQESDNHGQTINVGGDLFAIPFFPGFFGLPHVPKNDNNEYKLFRSACALKVIQNYGIMSKVVKTENGSTITTENIAYDGVTGDPLVTRTQNEFNKDIYSVNIPAYWIYQNMGGSYQTDGVILSDLKTDQYGVISSQQYSDFFTPGDEMINLTNGDRYWVGTAAPVSNGNNLSSVFEKDDESDNNKQEPGNLFASIGTGHHEGGTAATYSNYALSSAFENNEEDGTKKLRFKRSPEELSSYIDAAHHQNRTTSAYSNYSNGKFLMDRNGALIENLNLSGVLMSIKVVRSGFRNMLSAGTSSVVCLNNPIVNNQLQLVLNSDLTQLKVINASASTYNELWAVKPVCNNDHTIEDKTTTNFVYQKSGGHPSHAMNGEIYFYSATNNASYGSFIGPSNLKNRFDLAGIWMGDPIANAGASIGFETDFTVPVDGDYYVGYGGDDWVSYTIDQNTSSQIFLPTPNGVNTNVSYWYLCPVHLTGYPAKHHLSAIGINLILDPQYNNPTDNPGAFSLEIYANTLDQLKSSSTTYNIGGNVVFSTATLPSQLPATSLQSFIIGGNGKKYNRYDYRYCINPYVDGFLGNWRPLETKVFQQSRNYVNGIFSQTNKGIDAKNAGVINHFYSHWYYDNGYNQWLINPNGSSWITANTVTLYDKYGQQQENKDALDRYSAANFDFNGELPSAIASNAMNREIYSNSFEDLKFDPGTVVQSCNIAGFNLDKTMISSDVSHSGNYSLLLPWTGINLSTYSYVSPPVNNSLLIRDNLGEYNVQKQDNVSHTDVVGVYPHGFEPVSGKPYIFDVWVNDEHPENKLVNVMLTINGTWVSNLACKAVVEGWKLLEAKLDPSIMTAGAFNISIAPINAEVYIDDLRIHPDQAQMKTYVYDDKTLRLMAELDENCFATFYEYDDEGLLIRVKKETEKGIMTLKESRSSYRKTIAP